MGHARGSARFLALGGVLGPVPFATLAIVCAHLRPGYDHATRFISELGANGTPHAALMNWLGFVPKGIGVTALGVALLRLLPRTATSVAGAGLVVVFGVGIVAAGLFSCDPGCPLDHMSPTARAHQTISMVAFLSAIVATGFCAAAFRRTSAWRGLWRLSALASALTLVLTLVFNGSVETRWLTGVWQRLMVATLDVWCIAVGLRAFRLGATRT